MARFVVGIALLLVAFVPLSVGARRLRRALLPTWNGSPAWLADAAVVISSIIAVTQTLGVLGIFGLLPVTLSYLALGVGFAAIAARHDTPHGDPHVPAARSVLGRPGNLLAAAAVGLVAGPWTARASVGYTAGIPGADTLWYHLPAAARLVQTGSLREIQHFDAGNLTAWYPNASTFFHATGMLFLESDILTPVVNHAWVALALLAGWAVGRPFGVSAATLLATTTALSFPGFVGHQAGSAMNDVVGLALVLTALALLINSRVDRLTSHLPVIALAGAMTGVALATKWTAVPASAALTLGVLVMAERGHRLRVASTWLAFSGFAGLLTYVRNWILVGNPLPPIEFSLGPVSFASVGSDDGGYATIAGWLFADGAWSGVFRPGLDLWFGPLWIFALLLLAVGLLGGLGTGGSPLVRLVAAVGLVALASYLFSPQFLEFFGGPAFFLSNLRYGAIAIGLGFVLLPLLPLFRHRRPAWVAAGAFLVLLLASATSGRLWTGVDDWRFQDPVGTGDARVGVLTAVLVAAVGIMAVLFADRVDHSLRIRVGAALSAILLVILVVAQPAYEDERFADAPYWNPAVDLTDARIAMLGINTQFAMYGDDLSNRVQWLGRIDDSVFRPIETCEGWVTAINDGGYTHSILGAIGNSSQQAYAWMLADPSAVLLQDFEGDAAAAFTDPTARYPIAFFRIDAPLDAANCPD
jgi:hypothetical protein